MSEYYKDKEFKPSHPILGLPPRETLRSKKSPQPIEQTNPPNLNSIDGKLNTELTQSNEQTQELLSSGSDQNNSEGSSSNSSTESGEATNTAQTNQEPLSDPGKPPDPPGESEVLANTQTKKLKMPFEKLPSIEKLTRLNYEDWSVRVKLHLKLRDHWIEPNTAINTLSNAQKEINIKAGNFLILSIDNENRQMLSDADHDNFIVAWNKLRDIHQPRTQATLAEIYGNITHARHTPGSSINNHLIYLQTQFAMLADMREQLTEKQKVAFIQGTLRDDPEFGEVIKSSNWQDPNNLTSHKICQVLNASCSNKQFATSSVIEAHSSQFRRRPNKSFRNKRQRTFKCPPCGMNNHTYKDCGVNNPANSKRKPDRTASAEVMEHDSSSIKSRLGPSPRIKYRDERDLPASSSGGKSQNALLRHINSFSFSPQNQSKNNFLDSSSNRINCMNILSQHNEIELKPINEFKVYKTSVASNHKDTWIVDSGATKHMSNDESLFSNLTQCQGVVIIADGTSIPIIGRGNIKLYTQHLKKIYEIVLIDALLAPALDENLISVNGLTHTGATVSFTNTTCTLKDKSNKFVIATRTTSQYYVNVVNNKFSANPCVHQWHLRLAHRNLAAIRRMKSKTFKISPCSCTDDCNGCLGGKSKVKSFPKQSNKPNYPLDIIVSDICGQIQTRSINGAQYFLTIVDAHSDFTEVHLLKHKNEASQIIQNYVQRCINTLNSKPKIFRSDRGGEYLDKNLQDFFTRQGIIFQCTVHDSPQQNGMAERKNRTLMEAVRSILIQKKLPNYLWDEALKYANYTFNRVPRKHEILSPFEKFFDKSPINDFHEFGSEVYYTTSPQNRRKLDPRGLPALYLGVDEKSKGYRLYVKGSIRVERNVTFLKPKTDHLITPHTLDVEHVEPTDTISIQPRRSERLKLKQASSVNYSDPYFEPQTYNQALKCPNKEKWLEAMKEEISSIEENKTWSIVDLPSDRTAIGCKWVFKLKLNENGSIVRYKARLVACGYNQKYGIDYDEVFAPVTRPATFRTLLAVASKRNLIVKQFDVKTAFLNGSLDEEIFMKFPPGTPNYSKVLRLHKSLYGLKQAARMWNKTFHEKLVEIGFIQSLHDPCLYTLKLNNHVCFMITHVDDILFASDSEALITNLSTKLNKSFELKCLGNINQFLGINVTRNAKNIFEISQPNYILKIANEFEIIDSKGSKYPLDPSYFKTEDVNYLNSNTEYRKLIGMLLYISTNTRPDISAAVNILAQKVTRPRLIDMTEARRIVKYLVSTRSHVLTLGNHASDVPLTAYSDANWAESREDRKSISGVICIVFGGTVSWSSRKQSVVALSSTESEYYALAETVKETLWLKKLLQDFGYVIDGESTIKTDSQSCAKMVLNEKSSNRTKHIDVRYNYVKSSIEDKEIILEYCPTDINVADMMTKPLAGTKIKALRELANVNSSTSPDTESGTSANHLKIFTYHDE